MKKEKIQKIFIYFIIAFVVVLVLGFLVYYLFNYLKWQSYRSDENKKVFVERLDEAKKDLKKNKSIQNYIEIGNAYYNLEEYSLAERTFEKAAKEFEDDLIYNNLANVYREQKKYKDAQEAYLKMIDIKPSETRAYLQLHDMYKLDWSGKEYDPVSILELGLENNPLSTDLMNNLAVYYRDIGDIEKAIEYFEKSLSIKPDNEAVKRELENLKS